MKTDNKRSILGWILMLLTGVFIIIVVYRGIQLLRAWQKKRRDNRYFKKPIEKDIKGLSSEEARARKIEGMSNEIPLRPRRTLNQIWRENTFSKFNLSLLGIALVQLILGKPIDALLSVGILVLNITLNVVQEMIARRRLKDVELKNNPKTTLIRDGEIQSVNPEDIVYGDMLIIGQGDQLYADGEVVQEDHLIIDETILVGENKQRRIKRGDEVLAGSYCVSGRGVYKALRIGSDRKIMQQLQHSSTEKKELTPIERIINKVLTIMLIVVAFFTVILLVRYLDFNIGVPVEDLLDAFSVIFSLAPAGLFFMIMLTYTAGTADLAKLGALVREARSVETLAQIDTIFFTKSDVLIGTNVDLDFHPQATTEYSISETRIIQVLGDFSHTLPMNSPIIKAIATSYEGEKRHILEMAPFLSVYGWSAISIEAADLKGTLVLGYSELLKNKIKEGKSEGENAQAPAKASTVKKAFSSVTHLFRHSDQDTSEFNSGESNHDELKPVPIEKAADNPVGTVESENEKDKQKGAKKIFGRLTKFIKRSKTETDHASEITDQKREEIELIFAYSPEVKGLHDQKGNPVLPKDLIELCRLHFSERIDPETIETLRKFMRNKIDIKILSADHPEKTAELLKGAGWKMPDGNGIRCITGKELSGMSSIQRRSVIQHTQVFGNLTPNQAGQVVQILREEGQQVAVLGNRVKDVPALKSANLAIALQSSSQMARSAAHIILLEDSTEILQKILIKGQRIVNGLTDVLKLYLNQILYLTLLIVALRVVLHGFPYKSAQGGLISALTITLPSLGLSLMASAGTLKGKQLGKALANFLIPSVITIAAAGMVIYYHFFTMYNSTSYAQLTITYVLVGIGLVLVIMMKPPIKLKQGVRIIKRNLVFLAIDAVSMLAFVLAISIPLFQKLLKVGPLKKESDYIFIFGVIVVWAVVLGLIWFIWPFIGRGRAWMFRTRK